jgi:putative N6-adenine-specific DNA methylase
LEVLVAAESVSSFYVSCALGFEEAVATEIRRAWPLMIELNGQPNQFPLPEMTLGTGGVLVQAPLALGLQLNFFLKTAHRVLWRLAEFKVRDFPKLFEKIQKIPWGNFLNGSAVEWQVAAGKSRLNNEKRIEEVCGEAFAKIAGKIQGVSKAKQAVYVRIHDDLCTISLDSSGEHLHKRGWGLLKGEAPLRETLAAYMILEMMEGTPASKTQQVAFVDPMCGSGTLVLEAASLWQPVFDREYAFLEWKNAPKIFKSPLLKKNYKQIPEAAPFKTYWGFDIDGDVVGAARENLAKFESKIEIKNLKVRFENENLFEGEKKTLGPVWCLTNPPYGERLHVQGQKEFSYQDLLQRMADKFTAEKIGVLLPNKSMVRALKAPEGYKKQKDLPFSNGGLEVLFLLFTRK